MSHVNLCRLCVSHCDDYKSLYNESGRGNELYEITFKYFHPVILDMDKWRHLDRLCLPCWQHICDFHSFQASIIVAQEKLMADERELFIKSEVDDPVGPSSSKALACLEAKEEFISLPATENLSNISILDLVRIDDGKGPIAGIVATASAVAEENMSISQPELKLLDVHEGRAEDYSDATSAANGSDLDSESEILPRGDDKNWSELELTDSDPDNDDDFSSDDEVPLKRVKDKLRTEVQAKVDFPLPEDSELSSELELTDSGPENYLCTDDENALNTDIHDIMDTFGDKSKTKRENLDDLLAKWMPNIKCVVCPESYTTLAQLQNHFRHEHPKHKFYIFCCNRKLPVPTRLREHLLIHNDPEAFKCKLCARTYTLKSGLLGHMALRHPEAIGPKKHTCKKCNKSFDAARRLSFHVKVTHAVTSVPRERQRRRKRLHKSEIPPDGPNAFPCDECGKVFHKYRSFSQHQWYSHRLEPKHKCTICGKGFKLKYFLRKHLLIHTGYTCAFCPRTFANIGDLHAHRIMFHPEHTVSQLKK